MHRNFDKPFDQAIAEIDSHVAKLRTSGAQRIVIAGTSMGANATLFYAAGHPELAAILIFGIGPGPQNAPDVEDGVKAAEAAISRGEADKAYYFMGTNSGVAPYRVRSTPRIYVSYYGPSGAIQWPGALKAIRADMPVLLITGSDDASGTRRLTTALQEIDATPSRRLLVIDGAGHFGLSGRAVPVVEYWLRQTFAP